MIYLEVYSEDKRGIRMDCKHNITIPTIGVCCGAYYKSKRKDKKEWLHFPICKDENCPLAHPELLEGATLESED